MDGKCSNCGAVYNTELMVEVFTGRKQYLCWDCYKQGKKDAVSVEVRNGKKRRLEERRKHQ